jgi:hypothetical protein
MRKVKLVGAVSVAVIGAAFFAHSGSTQNPAAPYIVEPGISERFRGGTGIFTARVFCGTWKAIAQFTAGTGQVVYYKRTIYVCERTRNARVRFVVRPSQLGPSGKYQYRLKVGRHDANGNVTRWTHSLYGNFRFTR